MNTEHYSDYWNSGRLAALFTENTNKNTELNSVEALKFCFGEIVAKPVYELTDELKETYKKYTVVKPNDIMLNGLNLNYDFITQRVALVKTNGIITSTYICLRPRDGVVAKYYSYLLKTMDARKIFNGMGTGIRLTLSYNFLKNLILPIPPNEEQDQIVRYLNWKLSKINKLIRAKKKQIGFLNEKKQAYVDNIVINGIRKSEIYKDSGVTWIRKIPKSWSVIRCKRIFNERNERSLSGTETHLSMSQKKGLVPDDQLEERRMLSESYEGGKICYKDDLVLNRLKAHLGVFAISPQKGVISPDYTVLQINLDLIIPQYAEYVLKSQKCRRELYIRVKGVVEGFWRLYTDDLYNITIPLPPLSEQEYILRIINSYMQQTDHAIQVLYNEINLLNEYRTRLISDVVTGKVDVRGIEIPEYETVNEEVIDEEQNEDNSIEDEGEETEEES